MRDADARATPSDSSTSLETLPGFAFALTRWPALREDDEAGAEQKRRWFPAALLLAALLFSALAIVVVLMLR